MNQVKSRSRKEVMSCAVLTSRSVIFFAFHTASHKNQNCSGSSDPMPLKMDSLISSARWAMVVRGGLGGGQNVDGWGFTEADGPVAGILGLGGLADCDEISGVTELRGGVTGGFPREGFSFGSDSLGFIGDGAVSCPKE